MTFVSRVRSRLMDEVPPPPARIVPDQVHRHALIEDFADGAVDGVKGVRWEKGISGRTGVGGGYGSNAPNRAVRRPLTCMTSSTQKLSEPVWGG